MRRLVALGTILLGVGAVMLPAAAMGETSYLRGYNSHAELLLGTKIDVSVTLTGTNEGLPSICGDYEGTENEPSNGSTFVGFLLKSLKQCRKHEFVASAVVVTTEAAALHRPPLLEFVGHGVFKAAKCKWKLGSGFGVSGAYALESPFRYLLAQNTLGGPMFNNFEILGKKTCGTLHVEADVSISLPGGELIEAREF